jgi:hypothetical protein
MRRRNAIVLRTSHRPPPTDTSLRALFMEVWLSVDSLIPGTTLQRGTPWLATTRLLPEPRFTQDATEPAPQRPGRLAHVLSVLAR